MTPPTADPTAPVGAAASGAPAAVPFGDALRFWLKLGFISFGGPAGQIAIMHQELVDRRRWISERRFLHALNYCMLLPGPEAQQLATYLGWLMHRTVGGIVAGALFVLPSLIILILLAWLYMAFGQTPLVAGLFYGIKPAVVAIVAQAALRIGGRTLKHPALWAIALCAFVALSVFSVPFPAIIGGAALLGLLGGRWRPAWFAPGGGGGHAAAHADGPALIDDATPTPAHARFTWPRLLRVVLAGGLLWGMPMLLLAGIAAAAGLATMGVFFTKAALLTFGGAYAVLPYVYQGAVVQFGWLSGPQMIDGLALGETTPGPLIMVVAFVGFVGGWQGLLPGVDPLVGGIVGACVATWFTFLPSFIFILGGGPIVESTHQDLRVTAPLTAITAAVVGVIGNLALFFAGHVFWPLGWQSATGSPLGWAGGVDVPAVVLAALAALALLRYRRSVIEVIVACGLAGLAWRLVAAG